MLLATRLLCALVLATCTPTSQADRDDVPERPVAIRVVDERGETLAGADVRAHQAHRATSATFSDPDGAAQLAVGPDEAWLTVGLDGYEFCAAAIGPGLADLEPHRPNFTSVALPAHAAAAELVLRPVPSIELVVLDGGTGRAVEHAEVRARWSGAGDAHPMATELLWDATADGPPVYRGFGPRGPAAASPPFERVELHVAAEGFAAPEPLAIAWDRDAPHIRREIVLASAADALRVRGQVLSREGPLAQAPLEAWRWTGADEARLVLAWRGRADGNGHFELPVRRERIDDLLLVRVLQRGVFGVAGPLPLGSLERVGRAPGSEAERDAELEQEPGDAAPKELRELLVIADSWRGIPAQVLGAEPGVRYRQVVALEERGLAVELLSVPLASSPDGSPLEATFAVPPDPRRAYRITVGLGAAALDEPQWSNAIPYDGTQAPPLQFLVEDTVTLAGNVTGLGPDGARRHAVYAADAGSSRTLAIALLDAEGGFTLTGLPPRRYRIALAPLDAAWQAPVLDLELELETDRWDLELAAPQR